MDRKIWIFTGTNSRLPSGVFTSKIKAEEWISKNNLSGTLSCYPLNEGTYEHAIRKDFFSPKKDHESKPGFIADFSPRLPHFHYSNGQED